MFKERFIKKMSVRKIIVCFPSCKMGKVGTFLVHLSVADLERGVLGGENHRPWASNW
jgi:hypothetical protein